MAPMYIYIKNIADNYPKTRLSLNLKSTPSVCLQYLVVTDWRVQSVFNIIISTCFNLFHNLFSIIARKEDHLIHSLAIRKNY